jgi:hypothetical protein
MDIASQGMHFYYIRMILTLNPLCRARGFGAKVAVKQRALGGHDLYG